MKESILIIFIGLLLMSVFAHAKNLPQNISAPEVKIQDVLDIAKKEVANVHGKRSESWFIRDAHLQTGAKGLFWNIAFSEAEIDRTYVFVYMDGTVQVQNPE